MSTSDRSRTLEQIEGEVDRELADNLQRQSNAVGRCSIILAASGITAISQVNQTAPTIWIAVLLGFIAAAGALTGIVLRTSKAAKVTHEIISIWINQNPEALRERILADKVRELIQGRKDLAWKNRSIKFGTAFLAASWIWVFLIFVKSLIA